MRYMRLASLYGLLDQTLKQTPNSRISAKPCAKLSTLLTTTVLSLFKHCSCLACSTLVLQPKQLPQTTSAAPRISNILELHWSIIYFYPSLCALLVPCVQNDPIAGILPCSSVTFDTRDAENDPNDPFRRLLVAMYHILVGSTFGCSSPSLTLSQSTF